MRALRRFRQSRPAVERCELCSVVLPPTHPHLLEREKEQILCACQPCSLLFPGQEAARYSLIPRDCEYLTDVELSDAQWESLMIPIGMAFFRYSSRAEKMVAMYPSPAGAMESLLSLSTWQTLQDANPVLKNLQPDVEALLVNRIGTERAYFRVGIDVCFRLVGLIRGRWRGLSGGTEVWEEIREFFQRLKEQSDA